MTAPRTIRESIRQKAEDYRRWRWSERPDWQESIRKLSAILRLCRDDAERAFVMREAEDSPVKNTRGKDPNPEIQPWAEKVREHVDEHGVKIKPAAAVVLQEHIKATYGNDEPEAIRFFDDVCKRTRRLIEKREKAICYD
jgi:hypothetical protein